MNVQTYCWPKFTAKPLIQVVFLLLVNRVIMCKNRGVGIWVQLSEHRGVGIYGCRNIFGDVGIKAELSENRGVFGI